MSVSVVTGGSGFIGQHIVERLLARGEAVRILDLKAPPALKAGCSFIEGSVTDSALVDMALEGARSVYHTAAIPYLWAPDPAAYQEVNVGGTKTVLEAALKAGVERVTHTSSATVLAGRHRFGSTRQPAVVVEATETLENHLFGHYARSKWRAEAMALGYADRLSVVAVLPTLPLGPGDRNLTPPTRMLLDLVNGETPAYIDCLLNIVDVRDVARGHLLACEKGRSGQRYILNQHAIDMASFLRRLEAVAGRAMPRWRAPSALALLASAIDEAWSSLVSKRPPKAPLAGARMSLRPVAFDPTLARSALGFPSASLELTLRDAVAWLAREGYLANPEVGSDTKVSSDITH